MSTLAEMIEALSGLWTPEFGDLELQVHHTLTEPTCPTAIIGTELKEGGPAWRADADTIDAAIYEAIKAAYVTLVERKTKPLTFPVSDMDEDDKLERLLRAIDEQAAQATK